jgi:hypothetical protein
MALLTSQYDKAVVFVLLLVASGLLVWILPRLIPRIREGYKSVETWAFTLSAGWTVCAWVIALVWAF